ncbi:TPA: beta family protein [Vibrio campbellii]|uniref:beta family protein n=1 Tax=Vibrio campbellii TaxID=680 RepID=UPI0039099E6D
MTPKYVPILKAKKGEFEAYQNLSRAVQLNTLPIFELPQLTSKMLENKTYSALVSPYDYFVGKCAKELSSSLGVPTLGVDIHAWAPNSTVESGEHVLSKFVSALTAYGCDAIPVIGYDRWEDEEYATVLKLIAQSKDRFILRLDSFAFEDMIEGDVFFDTLEDIVSSMNLDTSKCSVLLDFGDVTKTSIVEIEEQVTTALSLLRDYKFMFTSIAGCSVTTDINGMVPSINSTGIVVRKEFKAWKAVKTFAPNTNFVFGDYGIANPNVADGIVAPDANGKIRYTIADSFFVVRGYSRRQGEKGAQMHGLCETLVNSGYYLGPEFSWGDSMIHKCSQHGTIGKKVFVGSTTNWVSIDTTHHMTFVNSEILEFERKAATKKAFDFEAVTRR